MDRYGNEIEPVAGEEAIDPGDFIYVGFWRRVGASLIDTVLILILVAPVLSLIYGKEYWQSEVPVQGVWDIVLNWLLPALVVVVFWTYKQATPGKMLLSAKIVDAKTGAAPSMKQWVIRYLAYYLSSLPLGLGFFWIGWDKRKQGWHDKLAGTVVVENEHE